MCKEIEGAPPSAAVPSVAMDVAGVKDLAALQRAPGVVSWSPSREQIARSYARARGRINTTELGSIVGAARTNVGGILRSLEQQGEFEPPRENRRGPGLYYRYLADSE